MSQSKSKRDRREARQLEQYKNSIRKDENAQGWFGNMLKKKALAYTLLGATALTVGWFEIEQHNTAATKPKYTQGVTNMDNTVINTRMELVMRQDMTNLEVQVRAIPQDCVQIGYMINGKTDNGKWYQEVLSYSSNRFQIQFEEWDSKLTNTLVQQINGFVINKNDRVDMKMGLVSGTVQMAATNLDNPEPACTITYSNSGAKKFVTGFDDPNTTSVMLEDWSTVGKEISEVDFLIVSPSPLGEVSSRYSRGLPTGQNNFVGEFLDARRTKWFIPEGPVFMGEYSVSENRYHLKMLRK